MKSSKKAKRDIYVTAIRSGTVYFYSNTGFAQYFKKKMAHLESHLMKIHETTALCFISHTRLK